MPTPASPIELDGLGVLRIAGADAMRFLQGQLSNDVARLEREPALLAGYHNPQGRVIAVLRLAPLAREEFLAVLPRELAAPVAARLKRVVLRAKVRLEDESDAWRVRGLIGTAPHEAGVLLRLAGDDRALQVTAGKRVSATASARDRDAWRLEDIACGLPQVYGATTESFLAQMLNLDLLDGISFEKGCYTGQEIIARAHYRGRVKRRLQRFRTLAPAQLAPGDGGRLSDGRSFKVVEAAARPDGCCEFLAVAPLPGAADAAEPSEPEAPLATGPALAAEELPLPYALPA